MLIKLDDEGGRSDCIGLEKEMLVANFESAMYFPVNPIDLNGD